MKDISKIDPKHNIIIKGAKLHNLKNVDVVIPRNNFTVITGLSGSGKSSLAYDTLYAEGQRRYVESLSSYARQFMGKLNKPKVDYIKGISPAIAVEQKINTSNPRSTVGTKTEIYDYLKLLFARIGTTYSPKSKWNELHLRIIFYGREYCPARGWDINNDIITKTIGRKSVINKLIK